MRAALVLIGFGMIVGASWLASPILGLIVSGVAIIGYAAISQLGSQDVR